MNLVSEKIYLRKITYEDTDLIVKWRNNPKVKEFFIFQEPFTKELHHQWMRNEIETGKAVQMIIVEKETGYSVGCVYVKDINRIHSKAEYGIFIGDDCARSKGIGNEAGKAMVEYAFRELRLHKIYLRVLAENEIARRSYRTLGFEEEAYLKQDVRINGTYYDIVRMACFNTYTR